MANFETVVRPVVLPNIRPSRPRQTLPPDDPTKGRATISGNGAVLCTNTHTVTISSSKAHATEQKRRVDEARIFQKEDDGTINRENFVDVSVANKIWMTQPGLGGNEPQKGDEVWDAVWASKRASYVREHFFFKPIEPKDNVEILRKDVIQKNPQATGEE